MKVKLKQVTVGLCLSVLAASSYAADNMLDLSLPASSHYTQDAKSFMLASNDADLVRVKKNIAPVTPAAEFDPPLISGSNIHQYLGISAVALAGMAMLSSPGEGCEENCSNVVQAPRDVNSAHAQFAKASAIMAVATVASGLISHWDDFSLEDGWTDPDNMHALLGVAGAALMAYAVTTSANSAVPVSHAGMAELGALGMVAAIKLTW
ncbi:MAG: hypothetical protein R8K20_01320 [Gallionellaceae bacterium]